MNRAKSASVSRVPWWASGRAKLIAGVAAALGILVAGIAFVPDVASWLGAAPGLSWMATAVRITGSLVAFAGTVWTLVANHGENDEINRLRILVDSAQRDGLGHAATEFRTAVNSLGQKNQSGWTPEAVSVFQEDTLKFGKSLFDYFGVPYARVCLYEPSSGEVEPGDKRRNDITALTAVWATPVKGRHDPQEVINRSSATDHLFTALSGRKPVHNKKRKKGRPSANGNELPWKSSMCMGVRYDKAPFALLTVDSTQERAFPNLAESLLILVVELLTLAEAEKQRRMASQRVPSLSRNVDSSDGGKENA